VSCCPVVPLSLVKEVRKGASTDSFKSSGKTYENDKCFSIIYDSDYKTLDLVCLTVDEAEIWANGIGALRHHTGMLHLYLCSILVPASLMFRHSSNEVCSSR